MSKNLRFNFRRLDLGLRIKLEKSTPALLLHFYSSIFKCTIWKKLFFDLRKKYRFYGDVTQNFNFGGLHGPHR